MADAAVHALLATTAGGDICAYIVRKGLLWLNTASRDLKQTESTNMWKYPTSLLQSAAK